MVGYGTEVSAKTPASWEQQQTTKLVLLSNLPENIVTWEHMLENPASSAQASQRLSQPVHAVKVDGSESKLIRLSPNCCTRDCLSTKIEKEP